MRPLRGDEDEIKPTGWGPVTAHWWLCKKREKDQYTHMHTP